jgi:hypothetical protein
VNMPVRSSAKELHENRAIPNTEAVSSRFIESPL